MGMASAILVKYCLKGSMKETNSYESMAFAGESTTGFTAPMVGIMRTMDWKRMSCRVAMGSQSRLGVVIFDFNRIAVCSNWNPGHLSLDATEMHGDIGLERKTRIHFGNTLSPIDTSLEIRIFPRRNRFDTSLAPAVPLFSLLAD